MDEKAKEEIFEYLKNNLSVKVHLEAPWDRIYGDPRVRVAVLLEGVEICADNS